MSIRHHVHWIHWTPLDNFTDGHLVQWTSIGHVHWAWCFQWTQCPMDTMFNGQDVQWTQWIQWTQCSMGTMSNGSNGHVQWCSMDTMDPLDKNTKLMFTRQTRFGDVSIGSNQMDQFNIHIGHVLWTSEMAKWIQWFHWTVNLYTVSIIYVLLKTLFYWDCMIAFVCFVLVCNMYVCIMYICVRVFVLWYYTATL